VTVRAGKGLFGRLKFRPSFTLLGNITDQALSSLTNLLVSLYAAHLVSVEAFGVVSILLTIYFVCVGIARAIVSEPLMLSKAQPERLREVVSKVASTSFVIGLIFAVATIGVWVLGPPNGFARPLVILGVGMPLLLLQDVARYIAFWRGTPWVAAANDLLWLVGALTALSLMPREGASAATVMACWVGSGAVAGVVFAIYLQWRASPTAARSWVRGNRRLIGPLLGEYGLSSLLLQGSVFIVTAVAGLRATAAFRGALVALGPVNVLTGGVSVFLVRIGRRSFDADPKRLPGFMIRRAGAMSAAVMSMCLIAYFVPTELGELMLGDVWAYARPLILPFSFVFAASALSFGAQTGLRLIGEAGRSFRVRAVTTPLTMVAIAAACVSYGVTAAAWAEAIGGVVATSLWWWTFVASHARKVLRTAASGGPRHRR